MLPEKQQKLEQLALRVREHIVRLSTDGGCFTGASLSCADLLVYLYADCLNVRPDNLTDPTRDYLFLSKGHDVPALYGTFVELGFMDKARLDQHLSTDDHIYWHPNRHVPGVEFHSGSLGHLPSVALGVAMDCRMRGQDNKVIVITGDGELNEGTVWESLLVASAHKVNNLTLVVDRNHFQANVATEDLIPLEPLAPKFEAFGCEVRRIDGHDFAAAGRSLLGPPLLRYQALGHHLRHGARARPAQHRGPGRPLVLQLLGRGSAGAAEASCTARKPPR